MGAKKKQAQKTPLAEKKPPEKVFHSIEEIRKHFFPNFYEKAEQSKQNPETTGVGLAEDLLEQIRRKLRE